MVYSFIIPVYNVEEYVNQCFNSVIKGIISECEIIAVINPNCNDRSNEICKTYENKYEFVKVITQNGNGLSNARNCGIKVATGDYIIFIDSDDYVDSEKLNEILLEVKKETFMMYIFLIFIRYKKIKK